MGEVVSVHTAPGRADRTAAGIETFVPDIPAWRAERYNTLVSVLMIPSVRRQALTLMEAKAMGFKLLPLLARETANGREELNYGVGNLRPGSIVDPPEVLGWHGDYTTRRHGRYRAYGKLADGVADFLDLLTNSNYGRTWRHLVDTEDVADWYESIIRAGYYPASETEIQNARREYADGYARAKATNLQYIEGAVWPKPAFILDTTGVLPSPADSPVATAVMLGGIGMVAWMIYKAVRK